MAAARISFKLSQDFKYLIEEWCIAEGTTTQEFLHDCIAAALEWNEPPVSAHHAAPKVNKRAAAVQAAIDRSRARVQDRALVQ